MLVTVSLIATFILLSCVFMYFQKKKKEESSFQRSLLKTLISARCVVRFVEWWVLGVNGEKHSTPQRNPQFFVLVGIYLPPAPTDNRTFHFDLISKIIQRSILYSLSWDAFKTK